MRRIALAAKSPFQFQGVAPGLVIALLACMGWADEPSTDVHVVDAPKSGVIIRLQLQPSTPAPKQDAAPELEANTAPEPEKIPATTVQFRRLSKSSDSSHSSRTTVGPLQRRLSERHADSGQAAHKGAATKPTITRSPATSKLPRADSPANAAALDRSSAQSVMAGTRSILKDRPVLELSANPKPTAESTQDSASVALPSVGFPATGSNLLELSPDERLPSETQWLGKNLKTMNTQTLDLKPPMEPNAGSSDSQLSLDADEGLMLDTPRSLTMSRAGSANKDRALDLDFSNERPLDSLAGESELQLEPDDVPLEQEPHPFDAPPAESIAPIVKRSMLEAEPFSERERRIEVGIARCLNYYMSHPENTTRRGPWALMHAALPFGVEGEVLAGNRRVNTIGWLGFNGTSGKQHMFQPTRSGFRPNVGPGMQGHEGQFLAILAQSDVRGDYPLQVNGRRYTVMDLAQYEMATCREKSELTFKLIGLSRYLEPNQGWRDNRGRSWTVEKMVAEEMAQPINGAACGGVHRLMGLSFAIVERQASGQPLTGNWKRAEVYLNSYVQYTLSLQNPDGSFSTNWFESRGMDPDIERRVQTSGHTLEWLVYTLPDEHLRSPQIESGIEFLLNTVGREPERDWPIGPRGHALRTMSLYSQRVFGAKSGQLKSYVAGVPKAASIR